METVKSNEFDFLRGKKINDMERLFEKLLSDLEQKHIQYFMLRKSRRSSEKHDKLHDHYIYYQSGNQASFSWLEDSDLELNIRKEAEEIFKSIFRSNATEV